MEIVANIADHLHLGQIATNRMIQKSYDAVWPCDKQADDSNRLVLSEVHLFKRDTAVGSCALWRHAKAGVGIICTHYYRDAWRRSKCTVVVFIPRPVPAWTHIHSHAYTREHIEIHTRTCTLHTRIAVHPIRQRPVISGGSRQVGTIRGWHCYLCVRQEHWRHPGKVEQWPRAHQCLALCQQTHIECKQKQCFSVQTSVWPGWILNWVLLLGTLSWNKYHASSTSGSTSTLFWTGSNTHNSF